MHKGFTHPNDEKKRRAKIGLPSVDMPPRQKKLKSDMKELFLKRRTFMQGLNDKKTDTYDYNKGNSEEDMDVRLNTLSALADEYDVEGLKVHEGDRAHWNYSNKNISIDDKSLYGKAGWTRYGTVDDEEEKDLYREVRRENEQGKGWLEDGGEYEEGDYIGRTLPYSDLENTILHEIAHAKQQKENTPGWQKRKNPLHNLGAIIGQPLVSLSHKVRDERQGKLGGKFSKSIYDLSSWLAGYSRPKSLEYEAHRDLYPKLADSYIQSLHEKGLSRRQFLMENEEGNLFVGSKKNPYGNK